MISFFQESGATRNARGHCGVPKIEGNPPHFPGKCFALKMMSQMTFIARSSIHEEATQGLWMVNGRLWADCCSELCLLLSKYKVRQLVIHHDPQGPS